MNERKDPSRTRQICILLGQHIAERRRTRGMTQQELAERVGIESVTLSRMETGVSLPSIARLADIADALDTRLAELVSGISSYASDQAMEIVESLAPLSAEDRALVIGIVKRLAARLAS